MIFFRAQLPKLIPVVVTESSLIYNHIHYMYLLIIIRLPIIRVHVQISRFSGVAAVVSILSVKIVVLCVCITTRREAVPGGYYYYYYYYYYYTFN